MTNSSFIIIWISHKIHSIWYHYFLYSYVPDRVFIHVAGKVPEGKFHIHLVSMLLAWVVIWILDVLYVALIDFNQYEVDNPLQMAHNIHVYCPVFVLHWEVSLYVIGHAIYERLFFKNIEHLSTCSTELIIYVYKKMHAFILHLASNKSNSHECVHENDVITLKVMQCKSCRRMYYTKRLIIASSLHKQ